MAAVCLEFALLFAAGLEFKAVADTPSLRFGCCCFFLRVSSSRALLAAFCRSTVSKVRCEAKDKPRCRIASMPCSNSRFSLSPSFWNHVCAGSEADVVVFVQSAIDFV